MYEQVGEILSHYRSGKIPKAFKILPNLANWEQVSGTLCMSRHARTTLCRFFSSRNPIVGQPRRCIRRLDSLHRIWTLRWLNGKLRWLVSRRSHSFIHHHRFYNLILLPRVRDDIDEYKKLNFHLYMVRSLRRIDHWRFFFFQALRKALFKPSAFFKGVILPLCEVNGNSSAFLARLETEKNVSSDQFEEKVYLTDK